MGSLTVGFVSLSKVARKGPTAEVTLEQSDGGGGGTTGTSWRETLQTERRACTKVLG